MIWLNGEYHPVAVAKEASTVLGTAAVMTAEAYFHVLAREFRLYCRERDRRHGRNKAKHYWNWYQRDGLCDRITPR